MAVSLDVSSESHPANENIKLSPKDTSGYMAPKKFNAVGSYTGLQKERKKEFLS